MCWTERVCGSVRIQFTTARPAGQLKAAANAETGLYCNKEIKFFQKTFDKSKSRGYNKIQYPLKCSEGNE
ncbi:hypothetical protein DW651_00790 [Subdoligranulum sp. AM23-21AC]|nr:hypothetical protein DW651_00790 [Subdoligranulum sp. AM23-21AC]